MAKNLQISVRRNSEVLHLKVVGDFDGISAYAPLSVLKRNCNANSKVFMHTSALRKVYPLGVNVFHKNLSVPSGIKLSPVPQAILKVEREFGHHGLKKVYHYLAARKPCRAEKQSL